MRPRASAARAAWATSTDDGAPGDDPRPRRGRRLRARPDARRGAPPDHEQPLRADARRPLPRLPGAGRGAERARRRRDRVPARDRRRAREGAEAVSMRLRFGLFGFSALGLAALFGWGIAGLHDFGGFDGPLGLFLDRAAVGQRHATNVVTAVVFDYRGFDTLGEEFILVASVLGVALLLREARDEDIGRPLDPAPSEALRALGPFAVGVTALVGLFVVAHGPLTPGGGFQGGVLLAAAATLLYLAGTYRGFRSASPTVL